MTKRKILMLVSALLVIMLAVAMPFIASAASVGENMTEFLGGTGSPDSPYMISNKTHLKNAYKYPDAHFMLISDINLRESDFAVGGIFYNGGEGWAPLGSADAPFTGSFDGKGRSITGLKITVDKSVTSSQYYGFFGYLSGGVKDLTLEGTYNVELGVGENDADGKYSANIGGLAAISDGAVIDGVSVDIDINYSSTVYGEVWAGGIVGEMNGGALTNSSNSGDITVSSAPSASTNDPHGMINAGGLAGSAKGVNVSKSFNTGAIDAMARGIGCDYSSGSYNGTPYERSSDGYATVYLGGMFGKAEASTVDIGYNAGGLTASAISKCSTVAATSSESYVCVGGCIGYSTGCTITNYFNTGKLSAVTSHMKTGLGMQSEYIKLGGISGQDNGSSISATYNVADYTTSSSSEAALDILSVSVGGITGVGGNISSSYYVNTYEGMYDGMNESGKLSISDFMYTETLSGFDFENTWELDITSNYMLPALKGMAFDGTFKVKMTGIEMHTLPAKTLYKKSTEELELDGVKIQIIRLGEYKCEIIDVTKDMISGWNIDLPGNQTITVTYEGFFTTFNVEVRDDNTTQFAGGLGTEKWPYVIKTGEHLNNVRNYPGAFYILGSDVDLDGMSWTPIGSFSGYLDGNGYVIENLHISSNGSNVGLFSHNSGTIKRLGVTGDIEASSDRTLYVGGIVADNTGVIEECFSAVNIEASTTSYAQNSYQGSIASHCYVGGIAGNSTSKIENCYFRGEINATTHSVTSGSITVCGHAFASGISNGAAVERCYSIGKIDATVGDGNVGLYEKAKAYVYEIAEQYEMCYYGLGDSMIFSKTYEGFDFDGVWRIDPFTGYSYPQLICHLKDIDSISIVSKPDAPIEMIEGLYPDFDGITVKVEYADGSSATGTLSPTLVEHLECYLIGTQTVTVRMGGTESDETLTFNIVQKEPLSIEIEELPSKLIYVKGQPLSLEGGKFVVNYSNTTREYIDHGKLAVSYNEEKLGEVVVNITYLDHNTQFTITVNERIVEKIELVQPTVLVYEQYRELVFEDGHFIVTFESDDSYSEIIMLSDLEISGFDKSTIGIQFVTVKYQAYEETFAVRVIECTNHDYAGWTITEEAHTRTCNYCGIEDSFAHADPNHDHACDYGCEVVIGACADDDMDHVCDYGCGAAFGDHADEGKDHVCDYGCTEKIGNHTDANKDHACDYGCADVIGTCADADKDHACDYGCSIEYGTHADADKDHVCDYGCTEAIGTHADEDKNHACDYGCSEVIGTHADEDKDHVCDYGCAEKIGTCADENKDHVCDYGCSLAYGAHADEDKDHACDYGCAEVIGTHADEDKNHVCDYGCAEKIGTCADENKDHTCDYGCGAALSECADKDRDYLCDVCGKDVPGEGLSAGAVAGIVIGTIAVGCIGGFSVLWFFVRKKTWADLFALFKKK